MASKVKGLTIDIGGDTSGLQKALSEVNKVTSKLTSELNSVNKALKFDPKNTELLQQKQDLLNKEIESTSNKLNELKKHQEDVMKSGVDLTDENAEKYRALQREIAITQSKLDSLNLQNSKWTQSGEAISKWGEKVSSVGDKISSLGNKLTIGVTVPIAAAFTTATKWAMEQETAMQQVDRIYGNAAGTIKNFAENTASSFNMSTSEAYKYAQVYGNLIQSITDDQTENANQTQNLLKASSVIASATGRTMEDVMDRIRSGLLGNTEAIEDLGVNVNVALLTTTDAFKKIAGNRGWNQLTFQEQQQVRLLGILEQTAKKYGDTVNKNTSTSITQLVAQIKNLVANLGQKLLPIVQKVLEKANDWISKLANLNSEQLETIVKVGLVVAAIGPLVKILGTVTNIVGSVAQGIGTFTQAVGVLKTGVESSNNSVNVLAKVLGGLSSPLGLAAAGIGVAATVLIGHFQKIKEEAQDLGSDIGNGFSSWFNEVKTAEGYLSSFNTTLFATSEEQADLQKNMEDVQSKITEICKTATEERRGLTDSEIQQLNEYFKRLNELSDAEMQLQNSIMKAIVQQATITSEAFQGTSEQYAVQSAQWIATAMQQKDKMIQIAEDRCIQELALKEQEFGEEAVMTNDAYAQAVNTAMQRKDDAIAMANEEVGNVLSVYSAGYSKQLENEDGFYNKYVEYQNNLADETEKHNQRMETLKNDWLVKATGNYTALNKENEDFNLKQGKLRIGYYKDLSEEEKKELGSWLGRLSQTEMYGGKISDEDKKMVDTIINDLDSMDKDTKEAMQNAMQPMFDEMQSSEPSLFSKATGIANGIVNRLRKAFDIGSPSKVMRKLFRFVMQGAELGLEDEEGKLNEEVEQIANDSIKALTVPQMAQGSITHSIAYAPTQNSMNAIKKMTDSLNSNLNQSGNYNNVVKAFKQALSEMKIEMDGREMAEFVDDTVSKELYS